MCVARVSPTFRPSLISWKKTPGLRVAPPCRSPVPILAALTDGCRLPHSRRWRRSWLSHLVLFHWVLFSVRPTTTRSRKPQLPNLYQEQDDRRCDLHVIFFHCNRRVKTIVASERAQRKRAYLPSTFDTYWACSRPSFDDSCLSRSRYMGSLF